MIEGPNKRYQIAISAFHWILGRSLNEAAYNTYRAGVMEIRIAGCSCRRPQLLFDQIYINTFFSHSIGLSVFLIFQTTTSRFEKWGGR